MGELTVKEKKQIVQQLADSYRHTTLSPECARRIARGVEARLSATPKPFMRASFRWGMGVAATLGVLTLLFVFWPAESEEEVNRATVAHLEGEVFLDEKTSVTSDSVFREGQVLQTRSDSHLSIRVGTHRIAMASRSRLKLERLQSRQFRFFLSYGKSTFAVSKLKRDEALEVVSGEVTVHVVGTRFSVEKQENTRCVRVAVDEGRVRTTFRDSARFIGAGESHTFCIPKSNGAGASSVPFEKEGKSGWAAKLPEAQAGNVVSDEVASDMDLMASEQISTEEDSGTGEPVLERRGIGEKILGRNVDIGSDEVLLFDNAHRALTNGMLSAASKMFEEYLSVYPKGQFAEDALFRRVRIAFRQKDAVGVLYWSDRFLQSFQKAQRHRIVEVRILRARTLIRQSRYDSALDVLAPLRSSLPSESSRHRHQITALQFTAACLNDQQIECQTWVSRYLNTWPNGAFAPQAREFAKK
jgi:TolA-binding protein